MEQSANLQLPYIMPSQAQKHVTHNEAIRTLDALVQLAVLDRHLSAPPASPADGDRYLVAVGGTAAWAGKDGKVAAWQDGAWAFLTPKAGWLLWIAGEDRLISFDGTAWMDAAVHSVNPALLVGVNANADATNRLAVKSPASLFDEEAGDHRLKINKAAAGDTASLVFQSGYSGRAEFGLAGDDDWHVKVSADGAVWTEALKVDRTTGRVSLPAALPLGDENQVVTRRHVREILTANRSYYVRPDGNNSNHGLANTSGGAFLTIQKALDVVLGTLDLAGFDVDIHVAAGTYAAGVEMLSPQTGAGDITIIGDTTAPANVHISTPSVGVLVQGAGCKLFVAGIKVTASYACFYARNNGYLKTAGKNEVGAAPFHFLAESGGVMELASAENIAGDAGYHYSCTSSGYLSCQGATWTATGGTRAFTAFVQCSAGYVHAAFNSLASGTVTGARYSAALNGVIVSSGGGASYFPGSTAGSTATGGQYV